MNAESPFGSRSTLVKSLKAKEVEQAYLRKCGADVSRLFRGIDSVKIYKCKKTGMQFYRPIVEGDSEFYIELATRWKDYYREERWEYEDARSLVRPGMSVLEIGCGKGFFLKSIEGTASRGLGIEINSRAIAEKVTRFPIEKTRLEHFAKDSSEKFNIVFGFQILEHVPDPKDFLELCATKTKPGGLLFMSTPNLEFPDHQEMADPFDMPPHHLNKFTPKIYRCIGKELGLKVELIITQPWKEASRRFWTSASLPRWKYRLKEHANSALDKLPFGRKSGHTVAAVFKVP